MPRKTARGPEPGPHSHIADGARAGAAPSKIGTVLDLLCRKEGATLAELVEATGWLPNTTRAALTGLRKKGHAIDKCQRDGTTHYRITTAR